MKNIVVSLIIGTSLIAASLILSAPNARSASGSLQISANNDGFYLLNPETGDIWHYGKYIKWHKIQKAPK